MNFYRFNVLTGEDAQQVDGIDYPILLNMDQIASIKPINIIMNGNIINGFWIRMANGKKYKATRIPLKLKKLLESDRELVNISINNTGPNLEGSTESLQQ
jgi:hypothetical protein